MSMREINFLMKLLLAMVSIVAIFNIAVVWHTVEQELRLTIDVVSTALDKPLEKLTHEKIISSEEAQRLINSEQRHALSILLNADVDLTVTTVTRLPRWSDIVAQYGPEPIIHNLESCSDFRATVPQEERFAAVSGLFNTGTNLLGRLMIQNCRIPGRRKGAGMRQQVPWGKHNPPNTHRLQHTAKVAGMAVNQTAVFPMVIIKDPYHWSISQCRHKYFTIWENDPEHCPNIVSWRNKKPTDVRVLFALHWRTYKTLIGMWNDWYNEYEGQSSLYPLVYLRFEDILFHPEYVINTLCKCVGGIRRAGEFLYVEESAKKNRTHEGANDLISAVLRYGDPQKRLEGWTKLDWNYANDNIDQRLMYKYSYKTPKWNN